MSENTETEVKPEIGGVSKQTFISVEFTQKEVEEIICEAARRKVNSSDALYYGEIDKFKVEDFSIDPKSGTAYILYLNEHKKKA